MVKLAGLLEGMNSAPVVKSTQWLSYHIFLPGQVDIFLQRYFFPAISLGLTEGLIKRFFYIRYSEGGPHLRVRTLPFRQSSSRAILTMLSQTVCRFARENSLSLEQCSVSERQYDRKELYFGDTLESVYSELLNEQTSILALRLICACDADARRLAVTLTAILRILFRRTTDGQQSMRQAIVQSQEFAARELTRLAWSPLPLDEHVRTGFMTRVRQAMPEVRSLAARDSSIEHLVRLLKRTRQQCALGDTVVTHSLHLFCNKLGVNLAQESAIYTVLNGDDQS